MCNLANWPQYVINKTEWTEWMNEKKRGKTYQTSADILF